MDRDARKQCVIEHAGVGIGTSGSCATSLYVAQLSSYQNLLLSFDYGWSVVNTLVILARYVVGK